jgi:hypothetical protein
MRHSFLLLAALVTWFTLFIVNSFADTLFLKGTPKFEGMYLLQTLIIVVSSCLFVGAVGKPQSLKKVEVNQPSQSSTWLKWGTFTWSVEESVKRNRFSILVKEVILWQVLTLSLSFTIVFLYNPKIFNNLALEDNLIEFISALLWLITCGVFLLISMKLGKSHYRNRLFYIFISLAFAFIFFILGMEEISWFQRILSVDTPKTFEGNLQNEMNLHNFATSYVEVCYYFLSFVWLIVLPFIKETSFILKEKIVLFFMPSSFIIFVSAIFMAYNYNMWNQIPTQIAFFLTLFIMLYCIAYRCSDGNRSLLIASAIIYVLTQLLFLVYGSNMIRNWDVTEYKEFFIPLSFMIYSLEILSNANNLKRSHTRGHA